MGRCALLVLVAACGDNRTGPVSIDASAAMWLQDPQLIVDGYHEANQSCRTGPCAHNQDTDLTIHAGATYLVHRTARSQLGGPNCSLRVYRSNDHGGTWQLLAIIPAPLDRDLRAPHFYELGGKLAIEAITRLPIDSTRDTDVDSVSVNTVSADDGVSWTPLLAIGPATYSFWRIRDDAGSYFSAAHEDGDKSVRLFQSADGQVWTPGAVIYDVADDTPRETELVFGGGAMTALIRMDGTDAELLGSIGRLRTKVCMASPPFTSFDCGRELQGVRLDGAVAFTHDGRTFVIARKHLLEPSNRKRTAIYELTSDGGIAERGEFPSAGDTSYAGIAATEGDRFLVSYYSSHLPDDPSWVSAMVEPTDIWQATIDLSKL